jgi:cyclopropane fatty-acyl-phospholipid synthase-like methyltransferase
LNRFETAYLAEPPWDIGRPQPAVVRLADEGLFAGAVLDAGCGTGENALYLAARGAEVVGVDFVAAAVERARVKARERGLSAEFLAFDALRLGTLGRTFDAVLDCGLFHTLTDEERPLYLAGLQSIVRRGGTVHLLCFSEEERSEGGPRRVTQAEIRDVFSRGFRVEWIRPDRFESRLHKGGARAWVARAVRDERS